MKYSTPQEELQYQKIPLLCHTAITPVSKRMYWSSTNSGRDRCWSKRIRVQPVRRQNSDWASTIPLNMVPGRQAGAKKAFLGLDAWSFQKWFTSWVMKLQQSPSSCFWGSLPSSTPSNRTGERKWLTMVNLTWNLICFKVNSGQGSLPGEGVSSGAPINMPTIPRLQQAHLGKKQSGKGISQKTLYVRIK